MSAAPVVAVVGLGYVGLPLAVEFGKRFRTIGYDRSHERVEAIGRGVDRTGKLGAEDFLGKLVPGGCVVDVKSGLDFETLRRAGCNCRGL